MTSIALLGFVAAICTTIAFIPQAYKTIRERATQDLSIVTFSMLFFGTILWFVYGYLIGDIPLMAANAITASLSGIIFYYKVQALRAGRE